MQEKKELNWINVAKAISIITVLFVHTENYYGLELGEINQSILVRILCKCFLLD